MLNIKKLFGMQYVLDQKIVREKEITHDRYPFLKTALLVELGECANEVRAFKDWSNKLPSEKSVILEEYIDGLHFVLSLGLFHDYNNDFGFRELSIQTKMTCENVEKAPNKMLTNEAFLDTYDDIFGFYNDEIEYYDLFAAYVWLGIRLGFTYEDMENAYFEKNKENHARQDGGTY